MSMVTPKPKAMPIYYPSPANKGSKKFLFPDASYQSMTPRASPSKKKDKNKE